MKHIRTFENYRSKKNREEIIKEAVLQVNDLYKVRTMVDIPQSLINSYIKRVKDNTGKNVRQFFSDVDIADEIVKYINTNFLDVENIPAELLMGGGTPDPSMESEIETQPEVEETPTEVEETPTEVEETPTEVEETPTEVEEVELPSETDSDFEEASDELEDSEQTAEEDSEQTAEEDSEQTAEEDSDDDLFL